MFDKVSRAKDYACIEVKGLRDPQEINNYHSFKGFIYI